MLIIIFWMFYIYELSCDHMWPFDWMLLADWLLWTLKTIWLIGCCKQTILNTRGHLIGCFKQTVPTMNITGYLIGCFKHTASCMNIMGHLIGCCKQTLLLWLDAFIIAMKHIIRIPSFMRETYNHIIKAIHRGSKWYTED